MEICSNGLIFRNVVYMVMESNNSNDDDGTKFTESHHKALFYSLFPVCILLIR